MKKADIFLSPLRQFTAYCILAAMLPGSAAAELVSTDYDVLADKILGESAFTGGLIVHADCEEGRLAAALRQGDHTIVHGLTSDAANVQAARAHLAANNTHGAVSVELWQNPTLPNAENLVNLLVVDDASRIPSDEAMRVLVPGGVLLTLDAARAIRSSERKPWPDLSTSDGKLICPSGR
jgi:hypothetical protein